MALPKFQDFLYPFLKKLENGNKISSKEMMLFLIEHFGLSPEDCAIKTKSGRTVQFKDRISWTRQWLRRALLIELPQRGIYRITNRGKEYLINHDSLTEADLLEYPEFAEYAGKSAKNLKRVQNINSDKEDINVKNTPTEDLENAYASILNNLADDLLQKVFEQTPKRFEHIVLDLLLKMGYGDSVTGAGMVTQLSHDGGIDGIIKEDKLGLDNIYIQAKRYAISNVIGRPTIQQFVGALDGQKASKGVFITTSSYSNEAKEYAVKASKKIVLIDGEALARYMIEYNVGVSIRRTFEIKRIDTDYFDDFENE